MEVPGEREEPPVPGDVFRELDRRFHGVAPRRSAEHDAVVVGEAAGHDRREFLDEVETRLGREIERVNERLGLGVRRGDDLGVRMTDVRDAHTGEEVEEDVSVDVAEGRALRLGECDGDPIRIEDRAGLYASLSFDEPFRLRSGDVLDVGSVRDVELCKRVYLWHGAFPYEGSKSFVQYRRQCSDKQNRWT